MKKIKNISIIVLSVITLIFGCLLFKKKDPDVIRTTIRMEVPVPAKFGTFEPIKFPTPKTEKPRPKLEEQFQRADSIIKDSLYADAVKERFYEEIFDDSTQTITVKSKVQGKLLEQAADYYIKPDTIIHDEEVEIPVPRKTKVFGHVEAGLDIDNPVSVPVVKGGIIIKTKNDNGISISADTQKRGWIGYIFKFGKKNR